MMFFLQKITKFFQAFRMPANYIVATCSALVFLTGVHAQNVDFKAGNFPGKEQSFQRAKDAYKDGDIFFENGKTYCKYMLEEDVFCAKASGFFAEALAEYRTAYAFNPNNALLDFKAGICFYVAKKTDSALVFFQKAYQLDTAVHRHIQYYLAASLQKTSQWAAAAAMYQRYLAQGSPVLGDKQAPASKNEIDDCIAQCRFALQQPNYSDSLAIVNLGEKINSSFSEYGPVVSATGNTLLFTARKPDFRLKADDMDSITFETDEENYIENIYITYKKDELWAKKKRIGDILTVVGEHNAVLDLSDDSDHLLTYKSKKGGDIYIGTFDNGNWAGDEPLRGDVNSSQAEPSACLSADGRELYFTSTRHGGFGGRDIYVSYADSNGVWGEPRNLGNSINTSADEDGVFVSNDGAMLYFSSNRHGGIGGYDLFVSQKTDSGWSAPKNLGLPINSAYDDIYYTQSSDGKFRYFASDRHGGFGKMDIYEIRGIEPEKRVAEMQEIAKEPEVLSRGGDAVVVGLVHDLQGGIPKEARISVFGKSGSCIHRQHLQKDGTFAVNISAGNEYKTMIESDGYATFSGTVAGISGVDTLTIEVVLHPAPLLELKPIDLQAGTISGVVQDMSDAENMLADVYIVDAETGDTVAVYRRVNKFNFVADDSKSYRIVTVAEGYVTQIDNINTSQSGDAIVPVAMFRKNQENIPDGMNAGIDSLEHLVKFQGQVTEFNTGITVPAMVTVYDRETGQKLCTIRSTKEGLYSCVLPAGQHYKIEVEADGYLTQAGYINAATSTDYVNVKTQILKTQDAVLKNNVDEMLISSRQQHFVIFEGTVFGADFENRIVADVEIKDSASGSVVRKYVTDNDGYFLFFLPKGYCGEFLCTAPGFDAFKSPLQLAGAEDRYRTTVLLYRDNLEKTAIRFPDIRFETAQKKLGRAYQRQLQELVQILQDQPQIEVDIVGHTDSKGSAEYNQTLSVQRAQKVADFLKSKGIAEARIKVSGEGELQPIADNETERGRQKNRRVAVTGVFR